MPSGLYLSEMLTTTKMHRLNSICRFHNTSLPQCSVINLQIFNQWSLQSPEPIWVNDWNRYVMKHSCQPSDSTYTSVYENNHTLPNCYIYLVYTYLFVQINIYKEYLFTLQNIVAEFRKTYYNYKSVNLSQSLKCALGAWFIKHL